MKDDFRYEKSGEGYGLDNIKFCIIGIIALILSSFKRGSVAQLDRATAF